MIMKKILPFILIGAFLFPVFGHVFAATAPLDTSKSTEVTVQTPDIAPLSVGTTDVNTQLHSILDRLNNFSIQTQTAIAELNVNGIDTTEAQSSLDGAKVALAKATLTLTDQNYSLKNAEEQIQTGKTDILQSLAVLKASLPALNQAGK